MVGENYLLDQPILFTRMGYSLKKSLNKEKNYLSLARRVFGLNGPLAVSLQWRFSNVVSHVTLELL